MSKRRSMSSGKSKGLFSGTAGAKPMNTRPMPTRGGFRL